VYTSLNFKPINRLWFLFFSPFLYKGTLGELLKALALFYFYHPVFAPAFRSTLLIMFIGEFYNIWDILLIFATFSLIYFINRKGLFLHLAIRVYAVFGFYLFVIGKEDFLIISIIGLLLLTVLFGRVVFILCIISYKLDLDLDLSWLVRGLLVILFLLALLFFPAFWLFSPIKGDTIVNSSNFMDFIKPGTQDRNNRNSFQLLIYGYEYDNISPYNWGVRLACFLFVLNSVLPIGRFKVQHHYVYGDWKIVLIIKFNSISVSRYLVNSFFNSIFKNILIRFGLSLSVLKKRDWIKNPNNYVFPNFEQATSSIKGFSHKILPSYTGDPRIVKV